jgi:DNA-binding response OmpR family regulator
MNQTPKPLRGRVLFVEDDQETLNIVGMMLGLSGYEAISASTVKDGIKFAKDGKLDLILLDWYFRDGTGIELCQTIRSFDAETPIFFYTGVALEAKLKNAQAAGAQGFLIKPIDFEKLLETITEYVLLRDGRRDGDGNGSAKSL